MDAIDRLYADGAVFYSHPFRDRQAPREYVEWAWAIEPGRRDLPDWAP